MKVLMRIELNSYDLKTVTVLSGLNQTVGRFYDLNRMKVLI